VNTADVIDGAIDILQKQGGPYKGDLISDDGRVCTVGALRKAAGLNNIFRTSESESPWQLIHETHRLIERVLSSELNKYQQLSDFNDGPNTTDEDIYLLLKKAKETAK
jgi:hypothetical protein